MQAQPDITGLILVDIDRLTTRSEMGLIEKLAA